MCVSPWRALPSGMTHLVRGNDRLTGGTGADRFSGGAGNDVNVDYTPTQGDTTDGS